MPRAASVSGESFRPLLRGMVQLLGSGLLVKPVWFIFLTIICARLLGAEGYGVFSTALSLVTLTFAFASMGLESFIVREVARTPEIGPPYFTNFFVLRSGLLLAAALSAISLGLVLGYSPLLLGATAAACMYQAGLSMIDYFRRFLQAFERFKWQVVSEVLEKVLVMTLGGTILVLTTHAVWTLSAMAGGMLLAALLTLGLLIRHHPVLRFAELSASFTWRSLRRVVMLGLAGVLAMIYFRVDTIMVEAILGTVPAGQYGLAFRLVEAFNMLPIVVVFSVMLPRLSKIVHADPPAYHRLVVRTALGLGAASVVIATAVMLLARPLITLLMNDPEFEPAFGALQVLVWSFPLVCLSQLLYAVHLTFDRQKTLLVALLISTVINIVLNLVIIPVYGIVGAAATTVASELVLLLLFAGAHIFATLSGK